MTGIAYESPDSRLIIDTDGKWTAYDVNMRSWTSGHFGGRIDCIELADLFEAMANESRESMALDRKEPH